MQKMQAQHGQQGPGFLPPLPLMHFRVHQTRQLAYSHGGRWRGGRPAPEPCSGAGARPAPFPHAAAQAKVDAAARRQGECPAAQWRGACARARPVALSLPAINTGTHPHANCICWAGPPPRPLLPPPLLPPLLRRPPLPTSFLTALTPRSDQPAEASPQAWRRRWRWREGPAELAGRRPAAAGARGADRRRWAAEGLLPRR